MVDFLGWIREQFSQDARNRAIIEQMGEAASQEALDLVYNSLTAEERERGIIKQTYNSRKGATEPMKKISGPLDDFLETALDGWLKQVETIGAASPEEAKAKLITITKYALEVTAGATAIDLALGALPNDMGTVSSNTTRQILTALGVSAVVAAACHDPVKIGVLRPYQDALEQTFRNRRPDDFALFQAYRTRELSPAKVEDLSKLTDDVMTTIEAENDKYYFQEISRWGYSEWFATALSRSATYTLSFSQLVQLAHAGIYDRGLFIYSLWGAGLDKVVMRPALDALETLRDREMYSGFRSMIEPSFVEGDLSEADLKEYWTLAGVPTKVQDWVIVRLRKRRETYAAKQAGTTAAKERDLTVSQITQSFQAGVIKRVDANNMITALGFSQAESDILLNLAETRIKAKGGAALKRLPLSDYEKAQKNKQITIQDVLERMRGEYAAGDIELERKLLEIGKA